MFQGLVGGENREGGQERRNRMNSERKWSEAKSLGGRQVVEKFWNQDETKDRCSQSKFLKQETERSLFWVQFRQETES